MKRLFNLEAFRFLRILNTIFLLIIRIKSYICPKNPRIIKWSSMVGQIMISLLLIMALSWSIISGRKILFCRFHRSRNLWLRGLRWSFRVREWRILGRGYWRIIRVWAWMKRRLWCRILLRKCRCCSIRSWIIMRIGLKKGILCWEIWHKFKLWFLTPME